MALAWDDALEILITAAAAVVFLVALAAARRTHSRRVILFAAAFGAYFLKGLFAVVEILIWNDLDIINALELLAEAGALALFLAGILKA